jgi:uncharacterized membrane protein YjfL (UPF0719 family)
MDTISLISGFAQLLFSFLLGLLVAVGSFFIFARLNRQVDEISELKANNVAVAILHASMMLAAALIIQRAVGPAISALQTALFTRPDWASLLKVMGLAAGYLVITILIALVTITISIRLFTALTRQLNEMEELRKNNSAVAIVLGAIVVIMSLFLAQGVDALLASLVPYPVFEPIQVLER